MKDDLVSVLERFDTMVADTFLSPNLGWGGKWSAKAEAC